MRKSEFKVAFCYNMHPEDEQSSNAEEFAEFDSKETIDAVYKSILELGYICKKIEFDTNFIENLKNFNPDLIFNIVEGFQGEDREAQAPAIYEFLGYKYTGSSPLGHVLALNKAMAKRVLEYCGVKTAPFQLFETPITMDTIINLEFPVIVKPVHEGSSIGVFNDALVSNFDDLQDRVNRLIEKYQQPALVEEFIYGREFNQAIIGNGKLMQFPIVEIDYSKLPDNVNKFSSYEVKTILDDPSSTICPAILTEDEKNKIFKATLETYRALEIRDFCRIDLRLGNDGEVYILEINSIPGIAPGDKENNSMPKAIKTFGWTYTQMIEAIINSALNRYKIVLEN